ncbi:MAG: hypothetical protein PBV86_15935 [Delftia lacustris]|uniref:hypothetical protein n=1 Tax=Delftia TaxID=80865 RepID=UPI001BCD093D|nr:MULTISPECIES: hypothetical protein [unclassified Delftia]WON86314.1 hypothetical protein OK021_16255 [Delftia sp. UGAL515B_04]
MSDSNGPASQNPLREGEYLVYGDAERMPNGGWAAFFRIDHHPEGQPLVEKLMSRKIVNRDAHKTADLARLHGAIYGRDFLREAMGKKA